MARTSYSQPNVSVPEEAGQLFWNTELTFPYHNKREPEVKLREKHERLYTHKLAECTERKQSSHGQVWTSIRQGSKTSRNIYSSEREKAIYLRPVPCQPVEQTKAIPVCDGLSVLAIKQANEESIRAHYSQILSRVPWYIYHNKRAERHNLMFCELNVWVCCKNIELKQARFTTCTSYCWFIR